jgi:hypothetical protein
MQVLAVAAVALELLECPRPLYQPAMASRLAPLLAPLLPHYRAEVDRAAAAGAGGRSSASGGLLRRLCEHLTVQPESPWRSSPFLELLQPLVALLPVAAEARDWELLGCAAKALDANCAKLPRLYSGETKELHLGSMQAACRALAEAARPGGAEAAATEDSSSGGPRAQACDALCALLLRQGNSGNQEGLLAQLQATISISCGLQQGGLVAFLMGMLGEVVADEAAWAEQQAGAAAAEAAFADEAAAAGEAGTMEHDGELPAAAGAAVAGQPAKAAVGAPAAEAAAQVQAVQQQSEVSAAAEQAAGPPAAAGLAAGCSKLAGRMQVLRALAGLRFAVGGLLHEAGAAELLERLHRVS